VSRPSVPITCLTFLFLLSLLFTAAPNTARADVSVGISVNFGPPAIPVYEQPPNLWPNYVWSPGYWAWSDGYYWVPGTWVQAPAYGLLWTPGYWAWNSGYYNWNQGFWASRVGFYGGVNYGYGYFGNGYLGGAWQGSQFRYNTAFSNVNRNVIVNVYSNRVGWSNNSNFVSYNGGRGGLTVQATQGQLAIRGGYHVAATSVQVQHETIAAHSRANFSTVNHGHPTVAAVARPLSVPQHAAVPQQRAVTQHAAVPQTVAAPQQRAVTQRAVAQHAVTQRAVVQRAPAQVSHAQAQPRRAPAVRSVGRPAAPRGGDPNRK